MWCLERRSKRRAARPAPRKLSPGCHPDRGVTLLELIMSMAIASGAIALAFSGYSMLHGVLSREQRLTDRQMEQNDAFSELETDLRNAGADPRGLKPYTLEAPPVEIIPEKQPLAGGLRLRADLTGSAGEPDGDLEDPGEVVTYALDPSTGNVSRWAANGSGGMVSAPLLTRVVEFSVGLEDRNGAPAAADVATQITVSMATRVDADAAANGPLRRQRFTVMLPNRRVSSH